MKGNMKVLFLDIDISDFADFFREQRNLCEICDSENMYNKLPSFIRKILQFIGIKLFPPILYLIYGKWKKKIEQYDYFILPSRKSCKYALKLLKNKKVIIYYWNLITEKEMSPNEIKQDNVKLCTFDEGDAKKYGIEYVDTYYFNLKKSEDTIDNDLFYVGVIRPQRIEKLKMIQRVSDMHKLNYDFHIMAYDNKKERLTYAEIVKRVQKSKVIVDLTREGQMGLTLRPLEALQFEKKLITDNKNIVNFEFYDKNNIFILGMDNEEKLYEFVQSPYIQVSNRYREKYYFENWLQRIIEL